MFSWSHYMLSTIQQSIQAGHCWVDMAADSRHHNSNVCDTFWDWAEYYKTVNVRNGGDSTALAEIVETLMQIKVDERYPIGVFSEDESLENCLTCVSVVIPESVYAWKPETNKDDGHPEARNGLIPQRLLNPLDKVDQYLYDLIKSTRHAI